jgi:hypothetical protein
MISVVDHQRVAALIRQPGMRLLYRDKSSLSFPASMIAFNPASRRYTRFPFSEFHHLSQRVSPTDNGGAFRSRF